MIVIMDDRSLVNASAHREDGQRPDEGEEAESPIMEATAAVDLFGVRDARALRATPKPRRAPSDLKPGEKFSDHITVLEKIGHGGYSQVYLVSHDEFPGQKLVMKISTQESAKGRATTLNEIRILQQLSNPNVIKILAAGDDSERRGVYAVMEYHSKGTLEDWVKRMSNLEKNDPLFLACLEQFARMLEGLEAVHATGLIHRDLKPSNILVADDGRLILADFGLSKDKKHPEQGPSDETSGSIGFLAPEEVDARVEARKIGKEADIFSVGALLKYLLTGRTILPECKTDISYATEVLRFFYKKRDLEAIDKQGQRPSELPKALVEYQKTLVNRDPERRIPKEGLSKGLQMVVDGILLEEIQREEATPPRRIAA